jgi:catechol 2,3-dioxygenase-like lactoylglutathione lyase family enzyme
MKLEFLYVPTRDLRAALALYRDGLGWQEAWREGESTVSLALPGTEVQLMLDATDPDAAFGPIFVVESVHDFHTGRPSELRISMEPEAIPGGFMATFEDQSGNTIYVMDQSESAAAPGTG